MDRETLTFLVTVLVLGALLVGVLFIVARGRERRERALLTAPPPGLPRDVPTPGYVQADALPRRPEPLSDDVAAALREQTAAVAPLLDVGLPHPAFATDPGRGWAVLAQARLALLAEAPTDVAELTGLLSHADGAPLVLILPTLPAGLHEALQASWGVRRVLPIVAPAGTIATLAESLAMVALDRVDLQSGWVPTLGVVPCWFSDAAASWALTAAEPDQASA